MSVNEENVSLDLNDDSVVDAILGNAEIANLPLNSPEMIAALANAGKTDEESADLSDEEGDEPAGEEVNPDEESDEVEESAEEKKKPAKGIQKRFDEMTRQIAELKEALLKTAPPAAEVEQEAPAFNEPKPRVSDFETVDEFYEADAEWRAAKVEFERSQVTEAEQMQQQVQELETAWDRRAGEARKLYPDFDEVVTKDAVAAAKPMQPAYAYAFKIEEGPQVIRALLLDNDKLEEFRKADAIEQVAIMAEIKASFKQPKSTAVSGAPTPPKKLPTASSAASTVYKDDMSDAEFDRLLASELKRKKRF